MKKIILLVIGLVILIAVAQETLLGERMPSLTSQKEPDLTAEQKANAAIFGVYVVQPDGQLKEVRICQRSYIYRLAK